MQRLFFSVSITLISTVLLLGCSFGTVAQTKSSTHQWQVRAKASADNRRLARQVILDSIYAGQTVAVANAYEATLKERPADQTRIANFAWAAMMAERYSRDRQNPELNPFGCHSPKLASLPVLSESALRRNS